MRSIRTRGDAPRTATPHRPRLRTWLIGGTGALLVAGLAIVGVTTLAWGASLREEGRLLPGTTIAGVDVGGETVEAARHAIEAQLGTRLDRVVEVVADAGGRWRTTARELGATTDLDQILADAIEQTTTAGLAELAVVRLTGSRTSVGLDVAVDVPQDAVAAFVADIAGDIDRDPRDAQVSWSDDRFEVTAHRPGRQLVRDALSDVLGQALNGATATVTVEVEALDPTVTADMAQAAADAAGTAIDAALDRPVTVSAGDATSTITPRELGAVPDVTAVLDAAFDAPGQRLTAADVHLDVPGDAIVRVIDRLAEDVEVAARDATLDFASGRLTVAPERTGRRLDRDAAAGGLRAAIAGGEEQVELERAAVRPAVTSDAFERALVLNQAQRRLYYYRDGEVVRSWPVAVGQGGSPTPTGTFTVGAKRYEPTWNNPAPNGWGSGMPAQMGPGPDNPLGARALNWNRGGQDTLIRFHGTPNEASIGQAASRGCVRMYNRDVIELYDLVPTGTTIVSVAG